MNNLNKRLEILQTAGQIEDDSVKLAGQIIKQLKEKYQIELTEENGSMLITHVVMANERLKKNEPVEEVSDIILAEIQSGKSYDKVTAISEDIIKLYGSNFVESERGYILMHISNLVGEE